jgi:hypothetical protein
MNTRLLIPIFLMLAVSATAQAGEARAQICEDAVTVPLQRERTGHVSVTLTINGVSARMLVDTGANTNTLDIEEGKRLNPSVTSYAGAGRGEGIASMPVAVGAVALGPQQFTVMDLKFINIPSKRFGTEPFLGQLGAQFFTDFRARVDFGKMVMCLATPVLQQ